MNELVPVDVHLILLAGGLGRRAAGADGLPPKQFRPTGQGLLLQVSLTEFLRLSARDGGLVTSVTVAVPDAWQETAAAALADLNVPWRIVPGAETRTQSTWHAVQQLQAGGPEFPSPGPDDLVAVHDAARPFATVHLLGRLVRAARKTGAAVPGVPVTDTIVQVGERIGADQDESVEAARAAYLDRATLLGLQTPQVFRWQPFLDAHTWAAENVLQFTDDGGLLAARGLSPAVVYGETSNWKVTTAADWQRAVDLLNE